MKRILYIITLAALGFIINGCDKYDEWPAGASEYENAYYIGFQDWGKNDNKIIFSVKKDSTLGIPVQFFSEQNKNYDVTIKYYVTNSAFAATGAVLGTDYNIVDENGTVLSPDGNGAFTMQWPHALKGVKNVYVKALNNTAATGTMSFYLQFFDPADTTGITVSNRLNNSTTDYSVSAFTQNYRRRVNIQ